MTQTKTSKNRSQLVWLGSAIAMITLAGCESVPEAVDAASRAATKSLTKQEPPVGGTPRDFSMPAIETYSLDNGVHVTLVPYGRVPKTTIRTEVRVGNLNDGDDTWLADLTGALMQEGADGQSSADLARQAAAMGGDLNLGVGLDRTFVSMDVLSESAPDAIGLIADVIQRPNLAGTELDRVRSDLVRNLSISRTQAQSQAGEALSAILYPDHPYGRSLPLDGQLENYTLSDVKAFHANNFGGARTHIYVVGQFDESTMRDAIKAEFGGWATGNAPLTLPATTNAESKIVLIDRPGAPQSTIRLGKRVPALDGSVELSATNTLLGGYFSSRITRNIREDKGYTYSPGSQISTNYRVANWQQNADITSESTGPALAEILKEIRLMQNEVPSDTEVQGIKNYMNGIFVIRLASRGGMANQLSFVDFNELGADYLESYVGKVQDLTPRDFQNAANEHLSIDDMSLVVVGPLDTVRGQLEALPDFADRLPATNE